MADVCARHSYMALAVITVLSTLVVLLLAQDRGWPAWATKLGAATKRGRPHQEPSADEPSDAQTESLIDAINGKQTV